MVVTLQCIYSQDLDKKSYLFSDIKLEPKLVYESVLVSMDTLFTKEPTFSFSEMNQTYYNYNSKELNERLFSNINSIENTYIDHETFLRGCGYLENGVTNPIDSAGLMLSLILNNFLNNVLLTKGIFFKN
jgi:hypothetical protein